MPPPEPVERPPVVPGYTLQALLGRGGSGEVWRAVPRGGGRAVAVKVLLAGDPERQAREAALLGELDHPHLVRLHEVVHLPRRGGEPRVALVLDLLAGGSLAALLLRRGRLRPGEVVTAVAPVAAALAHVHEQGVVHGDLSPGNVVFTAEGRPVLTDLGVARVLGSSAAAEVTPAYVDPTVARGGATGPASDVFGVAAAAFHALTGVAPWNAATPADTLAVAAAGCLPDLRELAPDAPDELVAVIARGLAADPHERGSAAALALDLRHACRPEPVRLPAAGIPDDELGRTGRGPRTELTHQLPGRRAHAAAEPARRRRPRAAETTGPRVRTAVRRAALLGVVAVVVAAAGWAGARWGQAGAEPVAVAATGGEPAGRPTAGAGSAATAAPTDDAEPSHAGGRADGTVAPGSADGWRLLLQELYERRAAAFATGDTAALAGVYAEGSRQRAADAEFVVALEAAGEALRGFTPTVARVTEVEAAGERVTVRIVDGWPAYEVVSSTDPAGPPLRIEPPRPEVPVRLVLLRTPGGWRIESAQRLT